jgi:hypothetical protein
VSELRSALEPFRSESLPELPDDRIEEDFAELHRVAELIDLERLRRLAEIERRRLFERDGHLSAAAWLAARFRATWGRSGARAWSASDPLSTTSGCGHGAPCTRP